MRCYIYTYIRDYKYFELNECHDIHIHVFAFIRILNSEDITMNVYGLNAD